MRMRSTGLSHAGLSVFAAFCLIAAAALAQTPAQSAASGRPKPAVGQIPRMPDGKPDLSGVWQPDSDRPGTWAEANEGDGIPDPAKRPAVKKVEPIPYQPWAANLALDAYNRRYADNPVARCIPQLDLGGGRLYPWQFVQTPKLIVVLIESRHVFGDPGPGFPGIHSDEHFQG